MRISSDEYTGIEEWHASSGHDVQFYESDDFLADRVSAFIQAGLEAGDGCIVIATPAHREQIERRLKAKGTHLAAARLRGTYIAQDAAETLATFMRERSPDPRRFAEVIGGMIQRVAQGYPARSVRAYGEMVSLLWQEGNRAAAITLEELWNDLHDSIHPFSLCCAYPMAGFAGEEEQQAFLAICESHEHVMPAESYAALATATERTRAITLLQQRASSLQAEIAERKKVEERLRQLEARKDAFIVMASHELKTPVTSLKAFTQILKRRMAQQTDHQSDLKTLLMLDRMEAQLERLIGLVGELLDVSKMESHILTYRDSIFDFDTMVRETMADMQALSTRHTICLEGETGAQVYGDHDRLAQVLTSLLDNAIKYSPEGQSILVRLSTHPEPDSSLVEVAVQDHGMGISEQHQAYIFERFYQVGDGQGGTYAGLGIGLYIARQLVERHNGRLWVESQPGEGSTFHVILPCVRQDVADPFGGSQYEED
ncbi:MAG TPA: ATP-binding protein [Ktedonobacterales bacterium]